MSVHSNPTSIRKAAQGDLEAARMHPKRGGGPGEIEHLHRWGHHPRGQTKNRMGAGDPRWAAQGGEMERGGHADQGEITGAAIQ